MRFPNWLKFVWVYLLFLAILLWLLWKIRMLAMTQPPNVTDWLLVYLTGVYALLTLFLALVSLKSALAAEKSSSAAERAAKAMETSIEEARLSRWAQFGAAIFFKNGYVYTEGKDRSITLEILNVFEQPILGLTVWLWETEKGQGDAPELKYSSMAASQPMSVLADQKELTVTLTPSKLPESVCRALGEIALKEFRARNNEKMPEHSLCWVSYSDRATSGFPRVFVYDLARLEETADTAKPLEVKEW